MTQEPIHEDAGPGTGPYPSGTERGDEWGDEETAGDGTNSAPTGPQKSTKRGEGSAKRKTAAEQSNIGGHDEEEDEGEIHFLRIQFKRKEVQRDEVNAHLRAREEKEAIAAGKKPEPAIKRQQRETLEQRVAQAVDYSKTQLKLPDGVAEEIRLHHLAESYVLGYGLFPLIGPGKRGPPDPIDTKMWNDRPESVQAVRSLVASIRKEGLKHHTAPIFLLLHKHQIKTEDLCPSIDTPEAIAAMKRVRVIHRKDGEGVDIPETLLAGGGQHRIAALRIIAADAFQEVERLQKQQAALEVKMNGRKGKARGVLREKLDKCKQDLEVAVAHWTELSMWMCKIYDLDTIQKSPDAQSILTLLSRNRQQYDYAETEDEALKCRLVEITTLVKKSGMTYEAWYIEQETGTGKDGGKDKRISAERLLSIFPFGEMVMNLTIWAQHFTRWKKFTVAWLTAICLDTYGLASVHIMEKPLRRLVFAKTKPWSQEEIDRVDQTLSYTDEELKDDQNVKSYNRSLNELTKSTVVRANEKFQTELIDDILMLELDNAYVEQYRPFREIFLTKDKLDSDQEEQWRSYIDAVVAGVDRWSERTQDMVEEMEGEDKEEQKVLVARAGAMMRLTLKHFHHLRLLAHPPILTVSAIVDLHDMLEGVKFGLREVFRIIDGSVDIDINWLNRAARQDFSLAAAETLKARDPAFKKTARQMFFCRILKEIPVGITFLQAWLQHPDNEVETLRPKKLGDVVPFLTSKDVDPTFRRVLGPSADRRPVSYILDKVATMMHAHALAVAGPATGHRKPKGKSAVPNVVPKDSDVFTMDFDKIQKGKEHYPAKHDAERIRESDANKLWPLHLALTSGWAWAKDPKANETVWSKYATYIVAQAMFVQEYHRRLRQEQCFVTLIDHIEEAVSEYCSEGKEFKSWTSVIHALVKEMDSQNYQPIVATLVCDRAHAMAAVTAGEKVAESHKRISTLYKTIVTMPEAAPSNSSTLPRNASTEERLKARTLDSQHKWPNSHVSGDVEVAARQLITARALECNMERRERTNQMEYLWEGSGHIRIPRVRPVAWDPLTSYRIPEEAIPLVKPPPPLKAKDKKGKKEKEEEESDTGSGSDSDSDSDSESSSKEDLPQGFPKAVEEQSPLSDLEELLKKLVVGRQAANFSVAFNPAQSVLGAYDWKSLLPEPSNAKKEVPPAAGAVETAQAALLKKQDEGVWTQDPSDAALSETQGCVDDSLQRNKAPASYQAEQRERMMYAPAFSSVSQVVDKGKGKAPPLPESTEAMDIDQENRLQDGGPGGSDDGHERPASLVKSVFSDAPQLQVFDSEQEKFWPNMPSIAEETDSWSDISPKEGPKRASPETPPDALCARKKPKVDDPLSDLSDLSDLEENISEDRNGRKKTGNATASSKETVNSTDESGGEPLAVGSTLPGMKAPRKKVAESERILRSASQHPRAARTPGPSGSNLKGRSQGAASKPAPRSASASTTSHRK
ncbi:hypothetical protein BV25DRAFT_1917896 [Artomyces pyxidatus]|uniref:Uncharacterized protein n=1 Tax=Artomyces pyxidatus TaxID=48021 RepID=A0ACB8SWN5_9AGAM|nr:hypothetical protein BV25DRAFT_1917896 [Artomyces pyxidatus]